MELTQERLKELLHYDSETGVFTRKMSRGGNKAGVVVGSTNKRKYLRVWVDGNFYALHRLAFLYMDGSFPEGVVDHINGEEIDNSWDNLRDTTMKENMRNSKMSTRNTSGAVGVSFHKATGKWRARIGPQGKTELGAFFSLEEAVAARQTAEQELGYHINHGRNK